MKTNSRGNIIKMLIIALGVCAFLGTAVIASAAGVATAPGRDLVGRGTAISARPVASAETTATQQTTPTQQTTSPQQTLPPKGQETAVETTVADNAATGMIDQLYPFITMLALHFLLLALFMHLRLNQSRYGRSQAHYREIDDFHWRMQHLND